MDVQERLAQADPARGVARASRAERAALLGGLAQRQAGDTGQPGRRRFFVVPIAMAAALAVSVIGFAQPSRAALAWSPTADATPPASAAALKQVCAEGLPITAEQLDLLSAAPPDLVDTRGNASLVVWSTPALRLHCLLLDDGSGALVRGPVMLSEPLARDASRLSIEFMAGATWMGETIMVLSGQAPEGTADVVVAGQRSEDFSASLSGTGRFAVWWPASSGEVPGTVVARDAARTELDSLNLTDYYSDAAARQPAPPVAGEEPTVDPAPEMPGGGMLDLERPLPPVGGEEGGFEPAQITNVRVPAEVRAGTPLVIRFRMTDPSGYQAPVAFVGGTSGWVSSWCGFGVAAVRVSGDQRDGEYEISCLVPTNAPSAGYLVSIGCECIFPDVSVDALFVTYDFNVVGGSSDVRVPEIGRAEITSAGVIRAGSTFEVTTLAKDESGIAYVVAWVDGPNGRIPNDAGQPWASDMGLDSIVRSQAVNGWEQFVQTITLRDDAAPGRYRLWFSVGDVIGNREALYGVTLIEFVIE